MPSSKVKSKYWLLFKTLSFFFGLVPRLTFHSVRKNDQLVHSADSCRKNAIIALKYLGVLLQDSKCSIMSCPISNGMLSARHVGMFKFGNSFALGISHTLKIVFMLLKRLSEISFLGLI